MKILNLKKVISQGTAGLIIFIIICTYSGICVALDSSNEDEPPILVIGTSAIFSGNTAAARKSAISDALVQGLEEYLTRRLGSQGMMDNFSRIINELLPVAGDHADNYHILAEEQTSNQYKILVRVKLNEKMIEDRLKEMDLILMKATGIKVLFMVSQENAADENVLFWWGSPDYSAGLTETDLALHSVFQERGFMPVNRVFNFPEDSYTPEMTDVALNDEDIIRWGRLFSADVVIYGKCEIIDKEFVYAHLKSYNTEEGTLIYTGSRTAVIDADSSEVSDSLTESLREVTEGIAADLGPATIKAVEAMGSGVSKVEVELSGLKSFDQFRMLRSFLAEEIEGVESVIQSRIRPNAITVLVDYMGRKEGFVEQVMNNDKFPFLADISTPEEGKILIEIK